jgi:hypothetical protein
VETLYKNSELTNTLNLLNLFSRPIYKVFNWLLYLYILKNKKQKVNFEAMLKIKYLTEEHIDIVNQVCDNQLQELVITGITNPISSKLEAIGIKVTQEELNEVIEELVSVFDNLRFKPHKLLALDEISLTLFKHQLFNLEVPPELLVFKSNLFRYIYRSENFNKYINLN